MGKDTVTQIRKISLFENLPEEAIEELAGKISPRQLHKNDILFHEGDPGEAIYLIRTGWIKLVTSDVEGEELVLNHCGPGEVIGETELIDQAPRSVKAVAISSQVELLELKREGFIEVLMKYPALALDLMRGLAAKLRFAYTYIEKAVEWSQRIAEGDYSFAMEQIRTTQSTIIDTSRPDEARANELLSAFFQMVKTVKAREEKLKQQIQHFTIQIDETKRQEEVEDVIQSTFFGRLKFVTGKLRQQNEEAEEES